MHLSLIGSQTIIRTNGTHLFFTYRTFNTCETTMAIKAHTIVTSKVNSRPMDSACEVLQTVSCASHSVFLAKCTVFKIAWHTWPPRGHEDWSLLALKGGLWGLTNEVGGGGGELVPGRAYKRTKNAFQKKLHNSANKQTLWIYPPF